MKKAPPSGHDNSKPDLPMEIVDLLDLLVEIALVQIVADENNKQAPEEGEQQ
jgi:hypothetical protein